MITEPRDKYFGVPLSEWIKNIPNELDIDAVGFWQLVETGRDSFGFKDDDLFNFLSIAITSLLDRGGKPVKASNNGDWIIQNQYGIDNKTITSNILNEWNSSGQNCDEDGIWFSIYV